MSALLVTIPLSVLLALFFIVAYWKDFRWRKGRGIEQESLLPLADDTGDIPAEKAAIPKTDMRH